jgi:hypothetical protein
MNTREEQFTLTERAYSRQEKTFETSIKAFQTFYPGLFDATRWKKRPYVSLSGPLSRN